MKKSIFTARMNYLESLLIDLSKANLSALQVSLRTNNEWNYLHSYAQVARFLQCDPKTAVRLISDGLIRHTCIGGEISVFIPDILEAAAKYERVNQFITRIRSGVPAGRDAMPCGSTPPDIFIETKLYPERYIKAKVKYQGWMTNICIPCHLWTQNDKVIDFVNEVIKDRHRERPFRIAPLLGQC